MYINRIKFEEIMDNHDFGIIDVAMKMGINRSYLWKILNHKQRAGSKFIAGLINVFPEVPLESFFLK